MHLVSPRTARIPVACWKIRSDAPLDHTDTMIIVEEPQYKMTNPAAIIQMLKKEHDRLTKQIEGIAAALTAFRAVYSNGAGRRQKISAAGKARIAAAQRARWAKLKGKGRKIKATVTPKRRVMTAEARRKIAAAQRARWAKVKGVQRKAA
jgi:hypothetical protein